MFGVSLGEIILILLLCLLVFGGKLPEMAKKAGQIYADLKNRLQEVREEISEKVTLDEDEEEEETKIIEADLPYKKEEEDDK
jgi:Sec-independent protein translocase protein TatA